MTERKPGGVTFRGWIDHQLDTAQRRGDFDTLPGLGKPLPKIDEPRGELDWVVDLARRENLDVAAMLPPSLALRKELEDLPGRLAAQPTESAVREYLDGLNLRIRNAHLRPAQGPPVPMLVEVAPLVAQWRARRDAERDERARAAAASMPVAEPPARRARWARSRTRRAGPADG